MLAIVGKENPFLRLISLILFSIWYLLFGLVFTL